MTDNITVNPGKEDNRVSVATDEVDQIHYPVYKMAIGADGEAVLINANNPIPVQITAQTYETDIVRELQNISRKLSILIEYESLLHKVDLEEKI